jgi:hypothetical protein
MTTRLYKVLMGSCLALGLGLAAPASSEELRIGYISPVTGIFAQVGKDMVDGFQMYLDEHGGKLGGMDVKFIVEDDQGKPDAGVTKAKKLILQDKVHMFIGGLLASTGYALAPAQQVSVFRADKLDLFPSASTVGAMGLRQWLQESHRDRRRLCLRLRNGRRIPEGV